MHLSIAEEHSAGYVMHDLIEDFLTQLFSMKSLLYFIQMAEVPNFATVTNFLSTNFVQNSQT